MKEASFLKLDGIFPQLIFEIVLIGKGMGSLDAVEYVYLFSFIILLITRKYFLQFVRSQWNVLSHPLWRWTPVWQGLGVTWMLLMPPTPVLLTLLMSSTSELAKVTHLIYCRMWSVISTVMIIIWHLSMYKRDIFEDDAVMPLIYTEQYMQLMCVELKSCTVCISQVSASTVHPHYLELLGGLGWPVNVHHHPGWTGHISTAFTVTTPPTESMYTCLSWFHFFFY